MDNARAREGAVSFVVELNNGAPSDGARVSHSERAHFSFLASLPATVQYVGLGRRSSSVALTVLRAGEPVPLDVRLFAVCSFGKQLSCSRAAQLLFSQRNGALGDLWRDGAVLDVFVMHNPVTLSYIDAHFQFEEPPPRPTAGAASAANTTAATSSASSPFPLRTPFQIRSPNRRRAGSPGGGPETNARSPNDSPSRWIARYFGQQTALYLQWTQVTNAGLHRNLVLVGGGTALALAAAATTSLAEDAGVVGLVLAVVLWGVGLRWLLERHFARVRRATSYLLEILSIPEAALAEGHARFHPARQFAGHLLGYAVGGAVLSWVLRMPLTLVLPDPWAMVVAAKLSELLLGASTVRPAWDLAAQQTTEPPLIVGPSVERLRSQFAAAAASSTSSPQSALRQRRGAPLRPAPAASDSEFTLKDPQSGSVMLTVRASDLHRAQWLHRVVAFNLGAYLQEPCLLVWHAFRAVRLGGGVAAAAAGPAGDRRLASMLPGLHLSLAWCALRLGALNLIIEVIQPMAMSVFRGGATALHPPHFSSPARAPPSAAAVPGVCSPATRRRSPRLLASPASPGSFFRHNDSRSSFIAQLRAPRYFLYYGGATDDFLDGTTRFAFVCLFGMLSPASCVILSLFSFVQARFDQWKLCRGTRRSLPEFAGASHFAWLNFHLWLAHWAFTVNAAISLFLIFEFCT